VTPFGAGVEDTRRLTGGERTEKALNLPDADFSIQGVDANLAWAHSLGVARHLKVPIRVKFEWREKEGAARPGKVAIIESAPPRLDVA
jgi:hypothetical protein